MKIINISKNALIITTLLVLLLFMRVSYSRSDITLDLKEVYLAVSAEDKTVGLMNRKELCHDCGMLFVYNQPVNDGFWMKNTFLSLDMIFMDANGRVITLHENTEPLNTKIIYYPNSSYTYVLEVNAGFAKAKMITVGSQVNIKNLLRKSSD